MTTPGSTAWSQARPAELAPEALAAYATLGGVADRTRLPATGAYDADPNLVVAMRRRVRVTLGLGAEDPPLHEPELTERASADRDLAGRFAEQFVIDVAAITKAERGALVERFAASTFPLIQLMWLADFGARADTALEQVFGSHALDGAETPTCGHGGEGGDGGDGLWSAIDDFLVAVARLDRLDPVTSELVRLRGARAHHCRVCQSRRLAPAVRAGADESTFDQIDHYERSDLAEHHKVALRLTDAMLWTPASWPPTLADQIRRSFDPADALELVLDVTRNSANKIAVALGADATQVADGEIEYFDVQPDGQLVYDLQLD